MEFVKWTEIEGFHNIRKMLSVYPELLGYSNTVRYRGKVKLHGTNAAVQIAGDGSVVAQSRTTILTPTSDNAGFAKWVESNKDAWAQTRENFLKADQTMVVFGEWCGPGIQKGVAVNNIPNKIFAVFAVQVLPGDELIVQPDLISGLIKSVPNTYVLPWYGSEVDVEWLTSSETLQKTADAINVMVAEVEKCDPWVKDTFNVEGTGEGLVFYPLSHLGRKAFGDLCFKAKGDQHKVVHAKAPAQVDPEKAANAEAFAALVLTDARLEQGTRAVSADGEFTFEIKNVGKFIGWVSKDVEKETKAELEASGMEWKQVAKVVGDRARVWYLNKTKAL
ncbi:MAG TPA: RNA ligase family protein [Anaerovoracaceae bacterium]|nr:RNA ligase family protein [Anaerovoracaceae bacterium]